MHARIACFASLVTLACARTSNPPPVSTDAGTSPPAVAPTSPTPADVPPSADEPPARTRLHDLYLAPAGGGLVRIAGADGLVQVLAPFETHTIAALAADAEDRVYVAHDETISILADGVVTRVLPEVRASPINAIHAVSDRELWVAGWMGLSSFDGERWQTTFLDELGIADLRDVTVDAEGHVWIMGLKALVRRDGDRFTLVPTTEDASVLEAFVDVPGHTLSIVHGGGIDHHDGGRWTAADLGFVLGASVPSGRAWGTASADHGGGALAVSSYLQVTTRKEPWRRSYAVSDAKHPVTVIEDVEVDARGRSWVATDGGLLVIEPGASDFTWIAPGAIPGVEDRVEHMLALGRGPTLPALVDPGRGTVRGTVKHEGKPVAKAQVELCVAPGLGGSKGHPCEFEDHFRGGTTAADGTFEIDGVAPGRYRLAVAVKPGRWRYFAVTTCCRATRPGAPQDLGVLEATSGYEQGW